MRDIDKRWICENVERYRGMRSAIAGSSSPRDRGEVESLARVRAAAMQVLIDISRAMSSFSTDVIARAAYILTERHYVDAEDVFAVADSVCAEVDRW